MTTIEKEAHIISERLIDDIKTKGFAVGSSCLFSSEERSKLEKFIDEQYFGNKNAHDVSSNAPVIENLLGIHPEIDKIFNKVLSNSLVQEVIFGLLGNDYKIWEISARYSLPGDQGLGIHQDAFGQMNLALKLNDNLDLQGVTTFIPKSHFMFRWSDKISWARPVIGNLFAKKLNFGTSDFGFFVNKTWHGRNKNRGSIITKIILIGMFPAGAKFSKKITSETVRSIHSQNEELIRRINLDNGAKEISPNTYLILTSNENNKKPFTLELEESGRFFLKSLYPLSLALLLELFFRPLQFIYKLFKR